MAALDYAAVCGQLRKAVAAGDVEVLATELRWVAEANGQDWTGGARAVIDLLRTLPDGERAVLAETVARQYLDYPAMSVHRGKVPALPGLIAEGLPAQTLGAVRAATLAALGRQFTGWSAGLASVAEEELAAGRALAPEVTAHFRRAACESYRAAGIGELAKKLTEPVLNVGEEWADTALAEAALLGEPWGRLLRLALTATSARPSAKWDKDARALIEAIGADTVRRSVLPWLARVGRPRTLPLERGEFEPDVNNLYDTYNANALRGLAWLLALLPPHPDTARALGALVETSLRKVAGTGPRNPKVANAAVLALSRGEGEAALAELARLASRVTYKGTLKLLDAALQTRAEALGLTREEIDELAVPAYGLTEVGHRPHAHGELAIHAGKAVLTWRNAAGKAVKGIPAAVRRDHAEDVAELKAAAKDIDRMLSAQSERLDRQFLARRTWAYTPWRERYLDHPLTGTLARRLLWTLDGRTCGYADGALRDLTDDPVAVTADGGTVELWHPVGRDPAEVVAWRDWLERHEITQPFKQAHREVYLLTDAERATATYSNRFAAHILRQHQFHSLAAARGWTNKLRLMVDDSYPPATRELPQWGLRAEFWIEGVGDGYGADTTESGSYLRVATDQVRFSPLDAPVNRAHAGGGGYGQGWGGRGGPADALPLDGIPALVLSEVLRDVDLFVGVGSVGNDPTWQDGGPEGRFRDYWHSYGFGELSQGAETRRDLLTRLVPRLAIADRCTIEGRFLHVRGELHTYKIHLGSGNILMTPNDAYLCIVPKSGDPSADAGYLPYEGDRTLAVILSKAMLLARDTEITDRSIVSQL